MLDQLVAFCGERIALDDVLGHFRVHRAGNRRAASPAMSSDAQTAETLAVLDEQSEGGKDLLRLLSELIAHLRNLLVFQVNPDERAVRRIGGAGRGFQGSSAAAFDGTSAGTHRRIRRRRKPHEVGSEQEASFRDRAHQGDPESRPDHAHGSHRRARRSSARRNPPPLARRRICNPNRAWKQPAPHLRKSPNPHAAWIGQV